MIINKYEYDSYKNKFHPVLPVSEEDKIYFGIFTDYSKSRIAFISLEDFEDIFKISRLATGRIFRIATKNLELSLAISKIPGTCSTVMFHNLSSKDSAIKKDIEEWLEILIKEFNDINYNCSIVTALEDTYLSNSGMKVNNLIYKSKKLEKLADSSTRLRTRHAKKVKLLVFSNIDEEE